MSTTTTRELSLEGVERLEIRYAVGDDLGALGQLIAWLAQDDRGLDSVVVANDPEDDEFFLMTVTTL